MTSAKRLVLFAVLAVSVLVIAAALLSVLPGAPVPSPLCDANNVPQDELLHASALRSWLGQSHLAIVSIAFVLTFAWLYLQVAHRVPRFWAVIGSLMLAGAAALLAGLWVRSAAVSWARTQAGTCLADTLQSRYAWDVSYLTSLSDRFRVGGWDWAVFSDAAAIALLGILTGSLAYFVARKAVRI